MAVPKRRTSKARRDQRRSHHALSAPARSTCPRCGTDRNEAPCSCDDFSPSSPFAVLAALRGGEAEGAD
jgi:large subunit ribosomal protein L32